MAFNDEFPEDCKRLETFVAQIYQLLGDIARTKLELSDGPLMPDELGKVAREAWEEFANSFKLSETQHKIQAAESTALTQNGLTGAQLTLKLSLIDRLRKKFFGGRLRSVLLLLLDAIDNALDSLIEATGIAHALKELKDTLRGCIKEGAPTGGA